MSDQNRTTPAQERLRAQLRSKDNWWSGDKAADDTDWWSQDADAGDASAQGAVDWSQFTPIEDDESAQGSAYVPFTGELDPPEAPTNSVAIDYSAAASDMMGAPPPVRTGPPPSERTALERPAEGYADGGQFTSAVKRGDADALDAMSRAPWPSLAQSKQLDTNTKRRAEVAGKAQEERPAAQVGQDALVALGKGGNSIMSLPVALLAPGGKTYDWLKENRQQLEAMESEPMRARRQIMAERVAASPDELGKFVTSLNEMITDPTLGAAVALEQLPIMGAILATGSAGAAGGRLYAGAASRVSPNFALADAIGGGAASAAAASRGSLGAMASASAIGAGGDAAQSTFDTLMDRRATPTALLERNPDYRAMVAHGMAPAEARRAIATSKSRLAAAVAAPLGLLSGVTGVEALAAGRAATGTLGAGAKVAAKEFAGELPEELGTVAASNLAIGTIDRERKLTEGFGETAATTLIGTSPIAAMGGAQAALSSREPAAQPGLIERNTDAVRGVFAPGPFSAGPAQRIEPSFAAPASAGADLGLNDAGRVRIEPSFASFTEPGSPSDLTGLTPIVVPGLTPSAAVPQSAAATSVSEQPASPTAEQRLADRLATQLGIQANAVPQAQAVERNAEPLQASQAVAQQPQQLEAPASSVLDQPNRLPGAEAASAGESDANGPLVERVTNRADVAGAAGADLANQLQTPASRRGRGRPVQFGQDDVLQAAGSGREYGPPGGAAAVGGVPPARARAIVQRLQDARLKLYGEAVKLERVEPGADLGVDVASKLASIFQMPLMFVRTTSGPQNFSAANVDGTIVITANPADAPHALAMHEVVHSMPDDIKAALKAVVLAKVPPQKRADFERTFNYRPEAVDEELVAMLAQQHAKRPQFWAQLSEKMGDSAFSKLAKHLLVKLDELLAKFERGDLERWSDDVKAVRSALTTAFAETAKRQRASDARSQQDGVKDADEVEARPAATETWTGRRGAGYLNEADAAQAIPGRQKKSPELNWRIEPVEGGRFRLAGYAQPAAADAVAGEQPAPTVRVDDRPAPSAKAAAAAPRERDARAASARQGQAAEEVTREPDLLAFARNADGTVTVQGQPAAVKAAIPGIKGISTAKGVLFPKSAAEAVIRLLSPAPVVDDDRAAMQPPQQAASSAPVRSEPRFSDSPPASEEDAALKALSENDELFALPKSDKTTVAGIAADNDPNIEVSPVSFPGRQDYLLELASGKTARLMVRDASPYGPRVFGFNYEDGEAFDMATERPGENPEDVPADKGDVWIDVSLLESGDEGRMVYNIGQTYAHNTGRIFIGDPAGLSDEAMRRRPEQMLSSALKFGTTEHLAPHPRQVTGDAALGVPPLKWVYGDHVGNISRLIDLNLAALENAGVDGISFDPADGQYKDTDGQPISRSDITALGATGLGRAGLAGGRTLARGFVLRALLREAGGTGRGEGRRNGLLARLVRQQAVHPQAVDRLFYSRQDIKPGRRAAGLQSSSELAEAFAAAFPALRKAFDNMLARGERGEKGGLIALESADAREQAQALASKTGRTAAQAVELLGGADVQTFRSEDGDTQGFYDPKSGLTFIVLPNVTAENAPGVVLHEVTHSQQRADIDNKALALIEDRASGLRPAATREFLSRVAQRMADAGEAGNPQEATAYIVEQAVVEGRQAGFSAADGRFLTWVADSFGKRVGEAVRGFLALVRAWALRRGAYLQPSVDDLVAYAKAGVRSAARGDVTTADGEASASSRADQTLTPAFRKWFGKSKVVDADGKPLVVYHGTPTGGFSVFNARSTGSNTGNTGFFGSGSYFSPNPRNASAYGKNRFVTYLSFQKPFEWDDSRGERHMIAGVEKLMSLSGVTAAERARAAEYLAAAAEGIALGMDTFGTPSRYDIKKSGRMSLAAEYIFNQRGRHPETGADMGGERLRELFEGNGFDSVIAHNAEGVKGATEYVAFDPAQIKSATENSGAFDASDPDIYRSTRARGDAMAATSNLDPRGTPPAETRTRKVQRYGQDMMNRFTVIKAWVESQGVKLSDDADVWSFEERMHGRMASRLQDFRELTVKPIVKKIQAAGFTMAEVGEFLHMQHAEERNLQVAKLDPEFTNGSGIDTAAARKFLAKADPKLAEAANELRAITERTLKVLLDAGIISGDMTRAFAGAYKRYVPLKGFEAKPALGEPGESGKANSVDGEIDRATGRSQGVDSTVVENILRDHERAIMQAEKNTLGHSLIAFVTEIANPAVATIGDPEARRSVKLGYQHEVIDAAAVTPTVYRVFDNEADAYAWMGQQAGRGQMRVRKTLANQRLDAQVGKLADNEVQVYVRGHAVRVQLNDEGLARAYRWLGIEKLPIYLAMGRDINRWLAKAYTGYNPEFSIVNPVRDFTTGVFNITGHFGAAAAARAVAKYPKALASLARYSYTGKSTPSIDAYRASGGSTGAAYMGDLERIGENIQASYNDYVGAVQLAADGKSRAAAGAATRKLVRALTRWIEGMNEATENAFRLAVFDALREEHGINKAASAAKNATTNFNRRGELGTAMGAMYLFFNPAVQGAAAMASALTQGAHKGQARAFVAALMGVSYTLAALQYGDDEDDEWKKIPSYVKDRSLIIRLPAGRYITIPIPYGYAFAATAGNALYSAAHDPDVDALSMSLASSVLENFSPIGNPLGGANTWADADAGGLLELLPGVPFGELTRAGVRSLANRSGLGYPIAPESPFDEDKPDHLKVNRITKGSVYDKAASGLSDLTGGTPTQAGAIDVSPETLKFWTSTITGGAGTFLADTLRLGGLGTRKLAGGEGDLEPDLREIPIVRRFVREGDVRDARSAFWSANREAQRAEKDFNRAKRADDVEGMAKVEASSAAQIESARLFVRYTRQIKRLRDEIDEIAQDEKLGLGMKRIQVRELEAEEKALYEEAVREYGLEVRTARSVGR